MVLKKNNEIMENFAKVSTSRLFYNKSPRYFFQPQQTSHCKEMRNQEQTKKSLMNCYTMGLTREEFGKETNKAVGKKHQRCLWLIGRISILKGER